MRFDRSSKIADLWAHPVGHELLRRFLAEQQQDEAWPERPLVARLRIASLDKLAGPEPVDRLIEAVNADTATQQDAHAHSRRPAWWKDAVVYQIYVPSFMDSDHDGVGDIAGITQRLPYLEQLGIDTLWLCCAGAPGADCTLPDPLALLHGNPRALADMDELLHAAHSRGMRVVAGLDVSRLAEKLEAEPDTAACSGELDEALRFWKQRGVDGFYFEGLGNDAGATETVRHLCLKRLRAGVGGDELLVGGLDGTDPCTAGLFTAPLRGELDMVLDTSHLRPSATLVQAALRRKPGGRTRPVAGSMDLRQLKSYYLRWQLGYGEGFWMPLLLETPDLPRIISRVGANPVYRTVLAKMFAMLLFTLRGTPMLFQGEELGLANTRFSSPDEIRDEGFTTLYAELRQRLGEQQAFDLAQRMAADHARLPMPWSAGTGAGFTGAMPWMRLTDGVEHLNAAYQMQDPGSVWSFFRRLIELRRETPALVQGDFKPVFVKNKRLFCYFRLHEGEKWYVEMNLTGGEVPRRGRIAPGQKLVLSNYDAPARQLRPYEANLYRLD